MIVVRGVCEYCGTVTAQLEQEPKAMTDSECRKCKRPVVLRVGRGQKAQVESPVKINPHPNQI